MLYRVYHNPPCPGERGPPLMRRMRPPQAKSLPHRGRFMQADHMSGLERVRASAVCCHAGRLLCVKLRDPLTRVARLFPPGGAIEPGETPIATAVRETLEETGYHVVADAARSLVARYPYVWNGVERAVTTYFFAARLADPSAPPGAIHDVDYNEATLWLALDALSESLGFQPEILSAVRSLL
jgi:tRNA(adenine34) deaminase